MAKSKTYILFPKVIKNTIPARDWINFRKCRHNILQGQTIDGIKVVYKHKLFMASYQTNERTSKDYYFKATI
jgi:hypothetical protein